MINSIELFTTYFAKLRELPPDVVPVSICGKAPDKYLGLQYKAVSPKYDFFMQWKQNHDNAFYVYHFNKEVLAYLKPETVVKELLDLTGNAKKIALVCYEKPEDFCHRHLVAQWLTAAGYLCEEIGFYETPIQESLWDLMNID